MWNTVKEHLYKALNELLEKQFKEFKWWLNSINYAGKQNISNHSLEKADEQDIVDLMIRHYEENALEVCIDVLRKCKRNDLANNLEKSQQKVVDTPQLPDSSDYRNYIKQKFGTIQDHNAIPGEYMSLNQRYSNLIILNYHPSKEDRKHEITATGRKHVKIITERAKSSTSIKTLFNDDKQVVVLQGAAGIGKTTVVKKIMLDWASDNFYQDKFNYIFYISCREMNLYAESEKSSIGEIISKQCPSSHAAEVVIRNILKNERKLLFIIDGFDELRYSFDQSEKYFCIDPWKKEPMRILLSSLFKKKLLPQSYLIITTRPTALETLHRCLEHPHYFEILGFSTKKREKYFQNFFQDKDQATQAFRFVEQNDTLFTMCVSPLVSWIICTVMKQEMERGKDVQKTPYTLTVIYMLYLSSLLKFHYKEAKQDVQRKLKNVCFLAAEGNWKQQILFKEEDVKKHNLDQKNFIDLFLIENIFKRGIDCIKMYSFVHLRFQEFFAALYYVLEEGDEQYSENLSKKLQTLLKRSATSSKVDFVFHFLFGFLNEKKQMRKMKKEFGWKISPKNKEFILHWVRNNIEEWKMYPHLQKELFNYLYETQDDNFVKNAVCGITEIHFQCNSDMELMILSYCIQHCQNLENLCVDDSEFQIEKELFLPKSEEWSLDERYMEDFFQALTKLGNLKDLSLRKCSITESCSRHLVEIFKKNQKLNLLDLSLGKTDDRAVELLCEGLQLQDCKVERLCLFGKFLSESYSRHLAEVFRRNQRLKELQLWLSNPDDRAVELLLEGLQHPDCRIEKLGLDKEFITESCRKHLAVVLRKNQKLRELELNLKNTDDKIMEVLSEGLKHPKCKIETLQLRGEVLNETFSKHLEGILRKNQTLRELELTFKDTNDKTMEVLCEGLKHPKCKIEALWLTGEVLNESSNRHLEEVFRKNQSLKELGLFFKNPDGKTMEVLCERLKQPECKIETVGLGGQVLTESCSRNLEEVLRKNQRLRELEFSLENPDDKTIEFLCGWVKHPEYEIKMLQLYEGFLSEFSDTYLSVALRQNQRLIPLNLSLKNTDDRAMEMLHEGLQHSDCTLDKLGLVAEAQTESCSRHHAEVVGGSQKFKKLEFSFVNPNDKTMELLCEGLKDSQCKIEMLKIFGEFLTESNSRHLAEVLSKNHILRELELTLKSTDDKIIEVLCEGLKHPECKIEILRLGGEFLTESCSKHLEEVLRKNQRLRELEVSLKNPDDKTIEFLSRWIKHPEYKIKMIQEVISPLSVYCAQ